MRIAAIILGLCVLGPARAAAPPVTALAFTPDGKAVVVGSQAGLEVRTWPELQTARTLATELAHVHDLAFAPDGKTLAAVGGTPARSGVVELYHWPDGKLLRRTAPHRDLVYAVDWRADSAVFATGSDDRSVALHDAATGKTLHVLEGHSRGVLGVAFLPGDAGLVTGGIDESVRLWDAGDAKLLRTFPNHTRPVHDLAPRPGGGDGPPLVVSIGEDRTVRLWQPTVGRLMRFVRLESVPLAVAWTADGRRLLTACQDGRLRVVDPDTVEVTEELPAIDGVAHCLAAAPDGSVLVGGQGGQLRRVVVKRGPP
jgi:WD40 repeat protein